MENNILTLFDMEVNFTKYFTPKNNLNEISRICFTLSKEGKKIPFYIRVEDFIIFHDAQKENPFNEPKDENCPICNGLSTTNGIALSCDFFNEEMTKELLIKLETYVKTFAKNNNNL